MNDLAIVIPAYKESFLSKTLNSLAQQTNKNFTLYIGDDCSPFDLLSVINNFKDKLEINYTRFPENIGSRDLVLQWDRCIALTRQEKWLWLFSDDDLMDENCVECFYEIIKKKSDTFDVYRFNTVTINEHDEILRNNPIGPEVESSEQMAYNLLKGARGNSMPDHIFSRKVYEEYGGFVYIEYAQGADWAMSILYSKENGICIIPGAKVYWRYSGTNLSSIAFSNRANMMNGHLQFISWALSHFAYLKEMPSDITYTMMLEALRSNLKIVLINHYKGFNLKQILPLVNFYHKKLKVSYYNSFKELLEIQERHVPIIRKVNRLIFIIKTKLKSGE